jgi:hypothetical protein
MSVATEFAPVVYIPSRARPDELRAATVVALRPPSAESVSAPLRLTRRGVIALAVAVVTLALALVWAAWRSAPDAAIGPSRHPATVTVRTGDTLWSIANRVAPDRDPRAEVAELQQRNHLPGVDLTAGQVLRTH